MADYLLQEDGASKYVLEDASGDILLENTATTIAVPFIASETTVYAPSPQHGPTTSGYSETFTASSTWECPPGVTSVNVECWGGGGGGAYTASPDAGDGGGGGAYAANPTVPVTPGSIYTVTVGAGGAGGSGGAGSGGADSSFTGDSATTVLAKGGQGGSGHGNNTPGGSAAASTGTTKFSGGTAGNGATGGSGGGGGAAASELGAGASGSTPSGGAGVGGAGSGGSGGIVGSGPLAGQPGTAPGGGGGGDAQIAAVTAGAGASGQVRITWPIPLTYIESTTHVFPPTLTQPVVVPFIGSTTIVYTPDLPEVDVPFIASSTRVFGIFSLFTDIVGTGPGNGGEITIVRLAAAGTSVTATLADDLTASGTLLELTGDAGLPTDEPFTLTVDDEQLYVIALGGGRYRIRGRGLGNTTPAAHANGALATWGDSYDMAIAAGDNIDASFTADVNGSGSTTYPGWLICFDSSQAYLAENRYPFHVTELVGVFDAGAGTTGTNRLDASQPNAVCTPAAVSDDCPAALSNPARIDSDIAAGDVAVVRYTNPEASALDLGPRSVALQSWFGLKRVDDTDNDVTLTDPTGHVVDTNPGVGDYTGAVNGEWEPPVLGPGISPTTGDPTSHDVPFTTVTLPAEDRYFTNPGSGYAEKGWPICCLAVRQGDRRIPHWESWDWHDFNFVYCGFGTDDTYAQLLVNRNGMVFGGSDPTVALPGTEDIDGPNAVWDDGSYDFGASWYVALFQGPYLVLGPSIGGTASGGTDTGPLPVVDFPTSGTSVVTVPVASGPPPVEGGSGGGIPVPSAGRELFQVSIV